MQKTSITNTTQLIEQAMTHADMSQRKLAQATGIPQATLSRILSGKREMKMPEAISIASALGYTTGYLLGSELSSRVEYAARYEKHTQTELLKQRLLSLMEIDDFLTEMGF